MLLDKKKQRVIDMANLNSPYQLPGLGSHFAGGYAPTETADPDPKVGVSASTEEDRLVGPYRTLRRYNKFSRGTMQDAPFTHGEETHRNELIVPVIGAICKSSLTGTGPHNNSYFAVNDAYGPGAGACQVEYHTVHLDS